MDKLFWTALACLFEATFNIAYFLDFTQNCVERGLWKPAVLPISKIVVSKSNILSLVSK